MDITLRDRFIALWPKYFGNSELPITFYFSGGDGSVDHAPAAKGWRCLICELSKVRNGQSLVFNADTIACGGAKRYTGYSNEISPTFRYFLSCGIKGGVRGERYKISPEVVDKTQEKLINLHSEGKSLVFKRWDKLTEEDQPDVAIFFALPEVISGLFTLANFDQVDPQGVIVPFSAGCGSIIHYPYLEKGKDNPKCVLGMFDPSARPCVPENILSFAAPMEKLKKMISYMEESFLITPAWEKVKQRFVH